MEFFLGGGGVACDIIIIIIIRSGGLLVMMSHGAVFMLLASLSPASTKGDLDVIHPFLGLSSTTTRDFMHPAGGVDGDPDTEE